MSRRAIVAAIVVLSIAALSLFWLTRPEPEPEEAVEAVAAPAPPPPAPEVERTTAAVADLQPLGQGRAGGTVRIAALEDGSGLRIDFDLRRVPPGAHGLYLHEVGDCSAPDGSSAGALFDPENAGRSPADPAAPGGLLGRVVANGFGIAQGTLTSARWSLDAGTGTAILGRSVLVGVGEPDAGRLGVTAIACGVVRAR